MSVSQQVVERRLAEVGADFRIFELAAGASIIVTAYGGRIFGPFIDGVDPSGWISPAFQSAADFAPFYTGGDWNIGGERLWISPELAFFVGNREHFWETFSVPPAVDPGHYVLTSGADCTNLSQTISWATKDQPVSYIKISRAIEVISKPPWQESTTVRAAGYRQTIEITSSDPECPVVPWIVRQVARGGTACVPVDRGTEAVEMFGMPRQGVMQENSGAIRMPIAADHMYKIAIPARGSVGEIGYRLENEVTSTMLISFFSHDRQGVYHDEPPHLPGVSGFSSFVFQDDGSLGGYGELEIVGLDRGAGPDGGRHGFLRVDTWLATGEMQGIDEIATAAARGYDA